MAHWNTNVLRREILSPSFFAVGYLKKRGDWESGKLGPRAGRSCCCCCGHSEKVSQCPLVPVVSSEKDKVPRVSQPMWLVSRMPSGNFQNQFQKLGGET